MKRRILAAFAAMFLLALGVLVSTSSGIGDVIPRSSSQTDTSSIASALATDAAPIDATILTVIAQADFAESYSTVDAIARQSDLIVRGTIKSVEYLDFNTVTYSRVSLRVTKSFSPGSAEGDVITVLEIGGITSQAAIIESIDNKFNQTITEGDKESKVRVLLDGAPLPEIGDDAVYFLADGSLGIVSGEYYDVVGAYHGKFKISDGQAKRFAPEFETSAADDLNTDIETLSKKIDAAPKKK